MNCDKNNKKFFKLLEKYLQEGLDSDIIELTNLLNLGVNVNVTTHYNETPLFEVIFYGKTKYTLTLVKFLLEKGADPNIISWCNYHILNILNANKSYETPIFFRII
jgi:ankyrin repeat protein